MHQEDTIMLSVLAAMTWGEWILGVVFILVCVLLIMVILLQKGRGGGLSGAFGGAGGHSAFGAKTGDVFTWITVVLAGLFLLLAVVGNYVLQPAPSQSPPASDQGTAPGPAPTGGAPAGAPGPSVPTGQAPPGDSAP